MEDRKLPINYEGIRKGMEEMKALTPMKHYERGVVVVYVVDDDELSMKANLWNY